ncbi:MAG: helix-turn-helix domain-containing protein [Ruminococcus sp.]|nr:helix-turn-helix domain-containing protein [Ruminococcus sp.]
MSKELGRALRLLRKHSELTQKQVADVLHIDRSTYAYYESGTTEPDLKSIKKLAKIFNVKPADILPENDGKINVCLSDVTAMEPQEIPVEEKDKLDPRDEKIYSLSKEEQSFLIWYRTLTAEQKAKLKEVESEE